MQLPDYDYYITEYRGDKLDEASFGRLIRRAGSYIDQVTLAGPAGYAGLSSMMQPAL